MGRIKLETLTDFARRGYDLGPASETEPYVEALAVASYRPARSDQSKGVMMKKTVLGTAILGLLIAPVPASAKIGAEANIAHSEGQWGGEVGLRYALLSLSGFRLTPGVGAFLYKSNNDRYYMDDNGGNPRCRDSSNGQYADTDECNDLAAKAYARVEATYSFPSFTLGGARSEGRLEAARGRGPLYERRVPPLWDRCVSPCSKRQHQGQRRSEVLRVGAPGRFLTSSGECRAMSLHSHDASPQRQRRLFRHRLHRSATSSKRC